MKALYRALALGVAVVCVRAAAPANAAAPFSFSGTAGTFRPGSAVRVNVRSFGVDGEADAEVAVVALAPDEVVAVLRGEATDALGNDLLERRRPVRSARAHLGKPQDPPTTIDLGAFRSGFYGVRFRANGKTNGVQLVTVTTLGVLTTGTATGSTALSVDLRSLRARSDVVYRRYAPKSAAAAEVQHAGADGLASFAASNDFTHGGDLLLARADDGSFAIVRPAPYGTSQGASEVGFVQLDRPIYRPGHHVLYRGIVRSGAPGAYTIPTGERVVRVHDPSGKVIATQRRPIDAFGTFNGEVALPDDAQLGSYRIETATDADDAGFSQQFAVEAYKKPEYVVDVTAPAWSAGGAPVRFGVAARYFFGRPAAGMKLHYRAQLAPRYAWWRTAGPFSFGGYSSVPSFTSAAPIEGDAIADDAGHATIAIPTQAVPAERQLALEVDGRDESGHTVTAAASALVTPGSFFLTVRPKTYFNREGVPVNVAIQSLSYGTKTVPRPNTPVSVTFSRVWYDGGERHDDPDGATRSVVTGADGTATVSWTPARAGFFEVRATARDEANREILTVGSVWIASQSYDRPYTFTQVTVVPQKPEYRPGERATLLVTSPQSGADALVHVLGGARERVFAQRLDGATATFEVDPPSDVARYRVEVTVPTPRGPATASAEISVVPQAHSLQVAIRPDKAKYEPGERARFAVRVRDAAGKPVHAEVGLAVVDDAIFALRSADRTDPYATFYLGYGPYRMNAASWNGLDDPLVAWVQRLRLLTIGSTTSRNAAFVPQQPADTVAAVAPPPPPLPAPPSFDKLRSDFRDTAYWTPSAVTGADGTATVSFDWPDSLTTFTASGVAVTQQTDVGSGSGKALVTKDFLVRLAAPRFLRRNDAARMTAIAQGTARTTSAQLRFSAPELGVPDATRAVRLDPRATASTAWTVRGGELGAAPVRLAGASGALHDGLRVTLPVESNLTAEHDRAAGRLPSGALALQVPRGAEAGDLRIDIAPSAVAQLAADVQLLQIYPYYCVEQTMSAALPAIYLDRMRKRANLPPPGGPPAATVAKRAVDRLVKLQHADGSWGWWEHDAANPFMSAYALYGLAELARDGYSVPAATIDRGVASVVAQAAKRGDTLGLWSGTQPASEWNTRAFMLYALADAGPSAVDRTLLAQTDARVKDLNTYAIAVLGLAHVQLDDRAGAQPLLAELLRRVTDDGTYARWQGAGWHYHWEDDPIETTAYALRFVHAMTPNDPRVPRVVSWLRTQQRGSWFETTKDTAAAINAMSETIPAGSDELHPHETVRVTLDGRTVKTLRIDAAVLPRADASFVLPAALLRHGGTLAFQRTGTGTAYWATDWTRFVRATPRSLTDPDLSVVRTYATQRGNEWLIGDTVDVDVTVTARADAQFVAIEDPLPAGLEYQPRQHESGDDWSGLQFFDDRVVFFATQLSTRAPLRLRYTLRATTAGTFTAPPPSAYAMYGPPHTASGQPAVITIR